MSERLQVGVEDQIHPMLEFARAVTADAELLARGAAHAIGRNEVGGRDGLLTPGFSVSNDAPDLLNVLLERDELGIEANIRAQPLRMRAQDRLEVILVTCLSSCRTQSRRVLPRFAHPLKVWIGEVPGARDVTGLLIARAVRTDLVLDAEAAVDLHRSRRNPPELVLDGGVGMPLDDEAIDAVVRQQQSSREAVQAATDDEDGCAGCHLLRSCLSNCIAPMLRLERSGCLCCRIGRWMRFVGVVYQRIRFSESSTSTTSYFSSIGSRTPSSSFFHSSPS